MALSSSIAINEGSQHYPYPSHVNSASFLSIKLSGRTNYVPWKEQMLCLVDSHDMLSFIDGTLKKPDEYNGSKMKVDMRAFETNYREWKRSDTLVKGWIFGSLSEDVMRSVVGLQTANDVWNKLNKSYTTPPAPAPKVVKDPATRKKGVEEYIPLCRAIQMGIWEEALEFFNVNKDALIDRLNVTGDTALHVAIGNPENITIFENILELIDPVLLPTLINNRQQNPLHYAALLDHTIAAEKLVMKNPHLLFTLESKKYLPIQKAINNSHKSTFLYLLKMCGQHIALSEKEGYHHPFGGENGVSLIGETISSGLLGELYCYNSNNRT